MMADRDIILEIEQKRRFGNLSGVQLSEKLLAAVGNPQKELAFIHIAGTNGKGSTAAFLHSVLKEAGIRSGLFTSPHLIDFTERIQVDGEQIGLSDAAELGRRLLDLKLEDEPTMFDYCMAMAMLYFKTRGCKLVVLETGLGGRLDATNVIDAPLVCIVTKIGYDHMEALGQTLTEIASEKAGILKRGTAAVFESQHPQAFQTLEARCRELSIPFQMVDEQKIIRLEHGFSYPDETPYQLHMLGEFQCENAMAAILAARELKKIGYPISEEALHHGIAKAVWGGRMEVVSEQPFLMIDGAHNEDGARALTHSLRRLYPNEKFHFIMGVLSDKNYRKMAETVAPFAKRVTTVTPEYKRALPGENLAEYFRRLGVEAENKTDLCEALHPFLDGKENGKSCIRTVAFGSLYFVGELKKYFSGNLQ